jgi:serine O-acetyltransferase
MKKLVLSDIDNYLTLREGEHYSANVFKRLITMISPRMLPVLFVRISTSNFPVISRVFSIMNVMLFGIEVNSQCKIGRGLFLPHTSGTVIGARSVGDNCTIYQGVTIGAKFIDFSNSEQFRPSIGNNVTIGAGAKVLGGIHIGDNAIIGANTVVTKSVAAGETERR